MGLPVQEPAAILYVLEPAHEARAEKGLDEEQRLAEVSVLFLLLK